MKMSDEEARSEYLASSEYAQAARVLAFCRLWCLVEIFATIQAGKGLVFRGAAFTRVGGGVALLNGEGEGRGGSKEGRDIVMSMVINCSHIIDITNAACAVPADRVREMAKIEQDAEADGGTAFVNRTISKKLLAAMYSFNIPVVDNFVCGEKEALSLLTLKQLDSVLTARVSQIKSQFLTCSWVMTGG